MKGKGGKLTGRIFLQQQRTADDEKNAEKNGKKGGQKIHMQR